MRFKPVPPNWETDASIDATALPWRCRKPISALASPKLRTNSRRRERRLYASAATYVVLGYHIRVPIDNHIRVPIDRGSARLVLICARSSRAIDCRESTDFVEDPSVLAPALGICGDVSEADSWLFASCGEDGRRERNDLRQLSEVLGGGGQQELIFGSTRPTQAQSIQPEDALQMSEEHLDLLSFAT